MLWIGQKKFLKSAKTAAAILAVPATVPPKGWILPNGYRVEALLSAAFWQVLLKQLPLLKQGVCLQPESGLSQKQLLDLSRAARVLYWLGTPPSALSGLLLQHSGTPLISSKTAPENALLLNLKQETAVLKEKLLGEAGSLKLLNSAQFLAGLHPLFQGAETLPLAAAVWEQWQCEQVLAELCKDLLLPVQQRLKQDKTKSENFVPVKL